MANGPDIIRIARPATHHRVTRVHFFRHRAFEMKRLDLIGTAKFMIPARQQQLPQIWAVALMQTQAFESLPISETLGTTGSRQTLVVERWITERH